MPTTIDHFFRRLRSHHECIPRNLDKKPLLDQISAQVVLAHVVVAEDGEDSEILRAPVPISTHLARSQITPGSELFFNRNPIPKART